MGGGCGRVIREGNKERGGGRRLRGGRWILGGRAG